MSGNLYVSDAAARALEKAAASRADQARLESIQILQEITAECDKWLSANGGDLEHEPAPNMGDANSVDHTRRVNVPVNVPVNVSVIESLKQMYEAEGRLLNNTQHAMMEHHLRFDKDSNQPGYFSIARQTATMQAMAASVRATTDEVTRKTYSLFKTGPPETHRVLPQSDDEELLQLWAKKRGSPNEAEMYMLAAYIGVDVYDIYDWFKAESLQTKAIGLVMGEAFSRSKVWRKIGIIRWRAAMVQSQWVRRLAELREKYQRESDDEGEGEEDLTKTAGKDGDQDSSAATNDQGDKANSKKRKASVTLEDVRGEMRPFICEEMD